MVLLIGGGIDVIGVGVGVVWAGVRPKLCFTHFLISFEILLPTFWSYLEAFPFTFSPTSKAYPLSGRILPVSPILSVPFICLWMLNIQRTYQFAQCNTMHFNVFFGFTTILVYVSCRLKKISWHLFFCNAKIQEHIKLALFRLPRK